MQSNERELRALFKLRRIAQRRADEHALRLAELRRSKTENDSRIAKLDASMNEERRVAAANPDIGAARLAGYLAGVELKRSRLAATGAEIEVEIADAVSMLSAAHAETAKIDHLMEVSQRTSDRARSKRELSALDDVGRRQSRAHRP